MMDLIKIEWLKIKKYPAFWWMLAIVSLTYPGVNIIGYYAFDEATTGTDMANSVAKLLIGNPYAFPDTWHSVAYFSSFFILLPSVLVIMLIANEYTFKTHRQNIIDGWSRNQFISSKLADVAIVSFVITFMYCLVALGFGLYANTHVYYRITEQLYYIPLFFLQTFAQLSFAFLIGFIIRKAFIALGVLFFYSMVVENIATTYARFKLDDIGRFLPLEMSDRIIPSPSFFSRFGKDAKLSYEKAVALIPEHVLYTLLITTLVWWVCYKVNQKRDL